MIQQDLVEDGTDHLICVSEPISLLGLIKVERPRFRIRSPAEHPAFLAQEPGAFNRRKGAGFLQYVKDFRDEGLANVIARESLPFQNGDRQSRPGQQRRQGRAPRPSTDDQNVQMGQSGHLAFTACAMV